MVAAVEVGRGERETVEEDGDRRVTGEALSPKVVMVTLLADSSPHALAPTVACHQVISSFLWRTGEPSERRNGEGRKRRDYSGKLRGGGGGGRGEEEEWNEEKRPG